MQSLNSGTSLYLDFLRALAALFVFLGHAGQPFFSDGLLWLPKVEHQMVVIFFVLSGFLMSYVVDRPGLSWQRYVVDRFSRIASVAYPALLLTIVCDFVGRQIDPSAYLDAARESGYSARIFLSSLFLQQSGPLAASPGTNTPFWSLAYEVWYYIFLAICCFVRRPKFRLLWISLASLVAVPKILLLLPVWAIGFFSYKLSKNLSLKVCFSYLLALLSVVLLLIVLVGGGKIIGYSGECSAIPPLYFSTCYLDDFRLAVVLSVQLVAVDGLMKVSKLSSVFSVCAVPIRFGAKRSFSLYAFHMPLMHLAAVSLPFDKTSSWQVILCLAGILLLVNGLYLVTENRRDWWARLAWSALPLRAP